MKKPWPCGLLAFNSTPISIHLAQKDPQNAREIHFLAFIYHIYHSSITPETPMNKRKVTDVIDVIDVFQLFEFLEVSDEVGAI